MRVTCYAAFRGYPGSFYHCKTHWETSEKVSASSRGSKHRWLKIAAEKWDLVGEPEIIVTGLLGLLERRMKSLRPWQRLLPQLDWNVTAGSVRQVMVVWCRSGCWGLDESKYRSEASLWQSYSGRPSPPSIHAHRHTYEWSALIRNQHTGDVSDLDTSIDHRFHTLRDDHRVYSTSRVQRMGKAPSLHVVALHVMETQQYA